EARRCSARQPGRLRERRRRWPRHRARGRSRDRRGRSVELHGPRRAAGRARRRRGLAHRRGPRGRGARAAPARGGRPRLSPGHRAPEQPPRAGEGGARRPRRGHGRRRPDRAARLTMPERPKAPKLAVVIPAVCVVTRGLIDAVVGAGAESGAAICALPITETVKRVRQDVVETTLDRSELWAVQTPQAFRAALLREAHEKARRDGVVGTDDAMLVERLGHPVRVVRGLAENVKITTPEDLRRARRAWTR